MDEVKFVLHNCIICGNKNINYICDNCKSTVKLEELLIKLIDDYSNVDFKNSDNLFYNNPLRVGLIDEIVFQITEDMESPWREYYRIKSLIRKLYSVPKDRREWLEINYKACLESDLISDYDKCVFKCCMMAAYYKNHNYDLADKLASELLENDKIDYRILYAIGEFYMITRRYEVAVELLYRAASGCNDVDNVKSIVNKINECKDRENGDKADYLPSGLENRVLYQDFLNKIGIEIKLPKIRAKAPDKISKEDYPVPVEEMDAGFKSFVAFDVETTGIDHSTDSITEIAAIRVRDGVIVESKEFIFQELVYPYKKRIPYNVEKITGITNEMVSDSREIWEVFPDFAEFIGDDILLGYNCMTFDSKFLVRAGRLSNIKIYNQYFDVMHYVSKFKNKLNYNSRTLTNIGELLGIKNPNAHRALADAITTAKVYLKLLEIDDDL